MQTRRQTIRPSRGFTLIEVLVVVAIIGIAGAIVVPQMLSAGTLGVQAAARMVISDLLFAQNDAIAKQDTRRVNFDVSLDRYTLTDATGTALSVKWKGGDSENYLVDFKTDSRFDGVLISAADFNGNTYVEYDELGTPSSGGSVTVEFRQERYQITVAAFTGRVTITKL